MLLLGGEEGVDLFLYFFLHNSELLCKSRGLNKLAGIVATIASLFTRSSQDFQLVIFANTPQEVIIQTISHCCAAE
jgi:hypothetical protein